MTKLRIVSALLALAFAAVASLVGAFPAAAQNQSTSGTISLLDQTDWVTNTSPFNLKALVKTDLDPSQAEVVLTVYNEVSTRFQYQQTLQDKLTGAPLILERHALSELIAADGTVSFSLPVRDPADKRYYLKDPGIYPVRVDLRVGGTGTVVSRFVTHLINEPELLQGSQKLGVTTVLPVGAAQSQNSNDVTSVPDNGSAFETVSNALAAHPQTPVATLADPESLERLKKGTESTANVADRFKSALGERPALSTTWVPVAVPMYSPDLSTQLNEQFSRATSVLRTSVDQLDTQNWAATYPLDTTALNSLASRGFSHFVIREQDLASTQRSTTLTRPFEISLGKNKATVPAGMADQALANHFTDQGTPILNAHQLLAEMAVLWNDRPNQQRSVIVMPPNNWSPDAGFLETFLRGLDTSPILASQPIKDYFATPKETSGTSVLTRQLQTVPKTVYSSFPTDQIIDENKRIVSFANIVDTDNKVLNSFWQQLLRSQGAAIDEKTRESDLNSIKAGIDREIGLIHMPKERSIRLTARQGQIPISVQNDTGYTIHVVLQLTSDKLTFPDGSRREITVDRQHVTELFTIDARTSGAFPLQVRLESPDGKTTIERSRVTVRSTATSAIGIGLSIGAGIFLLLWWIKSAITARRKKAQFKANKSNDEPAAEPEQDTATT